MFLAELFEQLAVSCCILLNWPLHGFLFCFYDVKSRRKNDHEHSHSCPPHHELVRPMQDYSANMVYFHGFEY